MAQFIYGLDQIFLHAVKGIDHAVQFIGFRAGFFRPFKLQGFIEGMDIEFFREGRQMIQVPCDQLEEKVEDEAGHKEGFDAVADQDIKHLIIDVLIGVLQRGLGFKGADGQFLTAVGMGHRVGLSNGVRVGRRAYLGEDLVVYPDFQIDHVRQYDQRGFIDGPQPGGQAG